MPGIASSVAFAPLTTATEDMHRRGLLPEGAPRIHHQRPCIGKCYARQCFGCFASDFYWAMGLTGGVGTELKNHLGAHIWIAHTRGLENGFVMQFQH